MREKLTHRGFVVFCYSLALSQTVQKLTQTSDLFLIERWLNKWDEWLLNCLPHQLRLLVVKVHLTTDDGQLLDHFLLTELFNRVKFSLLIEVKEESNLLILFLLKLAFPASFKVLKVPRFSRCLNNFCEFFLLDGSFLLEYFCIWIRELSVLPEMIGWFINRSICFI